MAVGLENIQIVDVDRTDLVFVNVDYVDKGVADAVVIIVRIDSHVVTFDHADLAAGLPVVVLYHFVSNDLVDVVTVNCFVAFGYAEIVNSGDVD